MSIYRLFIFGFILMAGMSCTDEYSSEIESDALPVEPLFDPEAPHAEVFARIVTLDYFERDPFVGEEALQAYANVTESLSFMRAEWPDNYVLHLSPNRSDHGTFWDYGYSSRSSFFMRTDSRARTLRIQATMYSMANTQDIDSDRFIEHYNDIRETISQYLGVEPFDERIVDSRDPRRRGCYDFGRRRGLRHDWRAERVNITLEAENGCNIKVLSIWRLAEPRQD